MANLKTYSIASDITSGTCNARSLTDEITTSASITNLQGVTIDDDVLIIVGDAIANEGLLDSTVLIHEAITLDEYKDLKIKAIDNRTGELIVNGGFSYEGKIHSLSKAAQLNLLGTNIKKNDPAFVYPVKFKTMDSRDSVTLNNAAELDGFFLTALGTKRAHLDSGTEKVEQVLAATDKAGVDAVIDIR